MAEKMGNRRIGVAIAGAFMFVMAALILGSLLGIVPTEQGAYFAPRPVIWALGFGFLLGAVLLWIPSSWSASLRGLLFLSVMIMVAVVCNWSAFAPDVRYTSTTNIGPLVTTGEDPLGGRIVFGAAALLVDGIVIYALVGWIRGRFRPG